MTSVADEMLGHLQAIKERWATGEPDRFGVIAVSGPDAHGYVELLRDPDPRIDLARGLCIVASRTVDFPHLGWVPLTVTLDDREYRLDFAAEETDGPIRVRFEDGSERTLPSPLERVQLRGVARNASAASGSLTVTHSTDVVVGVLDAGPALLEPITVEEFRSIELLIGELYKAHAQDQLEADHARKILELAELLKDVARDTSPGKTPRWRPVGAIRAVLGTLFQAPFRDLLALSKIVEILVKIRWAELAQHLQQLQP